MHRILQGVLLTETHVYGGEKVDTEFVQIRIGIRPIRVKRSRSLVDLKVKVRRGSDAGHADLSKRLPLADFRTGRYGSRFEMEIRAVERMFRSSERHVVMPYDDVFPIRGFFIVHLDDDSVRYGKHRSTKRSADVDAEMAAVVFFEIHTVASHVRRNVRGTLEHGNAVFSIVYAEKVRVVAGKVDKSRSGYVFKAEGLVQIGRIEPVRNERDRSHRAVERFGFDILKFDDAGLKECRKTQIRRYRNRHQKKVETPELCQGSIVGSVFFPLSEHGRIG